MQFSGVVRVMWLDHGKPNDITVSVTGDNGAIEVESGQARVYDTGTRTYFKSRLGWSSALVEPEPENVPAPDHRWTLARAEWSLDRGPSDPTGRSDTCQRDRGREAVPRRRHQSAPAPRGPGHARTGAAVTVVPRPRHRRRSGAERSTRRAHQKAIPLDDIPRAMKRRARCRATSYRRVHATRTVSSCSTATACSPCRCSRTR